MYRSDSIEIALESEQSKAPVDASRHYGSDNNNANALANREVSVLIQDMSDNDDELLHLKIEGRLNTTYCILK